MATKYTRCHVDMLQGELCLIFEAKQTFQVGPASVSRRSIIRFKTLDVGLLQQL